MHMIFKWSLQPNEEEEEEKLRSPEETDMN